MKKFFIVLGCIFGFAAIVTLCYFFVNPIDNRSFEGKYFLYQTITTDYTDEDHLIENTTEIEIDENSYIQISDKNILKANNISELSFEDEKVYTISINGTEIRILTEGEKVYEGYYADEHLVIVVDDKDTKTAIEYYYKKI